MKYFRLSGWSWSFSSKNIPSFIIHERVSLFIVFIQIAFSPLLVPVSYAVVIDYNGQDISTITRVVWPWLTNNRDVFLVPNSWRRSFDLGGYFRYFLFSYFPVFSCILVSNSFTILFPLTDSLFLSLFIFFWYSLTVTFFTLSPSHSCSLTMCLCIFLSSPFSPPHSHGVSFSSSHSVLFFMSPFPSFSFYLSFVHFPTTHIHLTAIN